MWCPCLPSCYAAGRGMHMSQYRGSEEEDYAQEEERDRAERAAWQPEATADRRAALDISGDEAYARRARCACRMQDASEMVGSLCWPRAASDGECAYLRSKHCVGLLGRSAGCRTP